MIARVLKKNLSMLFSIFLPLLSLGHGRLAKLLWHLRSAGILMPFILIWNLKRIGRKWHNLNSTFRIIRINCSFLMRYTGFQPFFLFFEV